MATIKTGYKKLASPNILPDLPINYFKTELTPDEQEEVNKVTNPKYYQFK